jgi:Flp pilus assembly protein CpaB
MLLTRPKRTGSKPGGSQPRGGGPLSTQGGTIFVAAILSLVAGVALLLFLRAYRDDLTASDGVRVLVAQNLIPHGTPGEVVSENRLYKLRRIEKSQLADGASPDPSQQDDKVAKKDLFPGHQLSADDFKSADGSVGSHLAGFDRAMSVPVDKAHGILGRIDAGDRVDVITTVDAGAGAVTVAQVAARNALVLAVPDVGDKGSSTRKEQVTIRVPDQAAGIIAAAADGGNVWLVLRPAVGARSHPSVGQLNRSDGYDAQIKIDATVKERP